MYTTVYDPYGAMWEILTETASKLILNHGWTQSPVTTIPAVEIMVEAEAVKTPKK